MSNLKPYSRENRDIILDMWKRVAPHYWTHKMLAQELGLPWHSVNKMIRRARADGDPRAVLRPVGKAPW